jgi:hypothetical protein
VLLLPGKESTSKSWPSIFSASEPPRSNRKTKGWLVSWRYQISDCRRTHNPNTQSSKLSSLRRFRSRTTPEVERCYLKDTFRPMRCRRRAGEAEPPSVGEVLDRWICY